MRGKGQQLSPNPCRGRGRTRRRAGRAARRGGLTSQVEFQQETAVLTRKSRPRWKQHCPQDRAALPPQPPSRGTLGRRRYSLPPRRPRTTRVDRRTRRNGWRRHRLEGGRRRPRSRQAVKTEGFSRAVHAPAWGAQWPRGIQRLFGNE